MGLFGFFFIGEGVRVVKLAYLGFIGVQTVKIVLYVESLRTWKRECIFFKY